MATQSQIDLVRLFFNGNSAIQDMWTDDQIAILVDSGMSPIDCAIFIVDQTMSNYTTKPNIKVGQISLDWKAVIDGLNKLKLDLLLRKQQGAGDPSNPSSCVAGRRIGSVSFTGSCIPRKFNDGEFNNPPYSDL